MTTYGYTFSLSDGTDSDYYDRRKSVPVARIVDGIKAGKVVYLNPPVVNTETLSDSSETSDSDEEECFRCKKCGQTFGSLRAKNRHKAGKCKGPDAMRDIKIEEVNSFTIRDPRTGSIQIMPNAFFRENIYVAGPMGSGKSYFSAMYCDSFLKVFPNKSVVVFTKIPKDESFDRVMHKYPDRMKRFIIEGEQGDNLLENPVNVKQELQNCLVVFDDIESSCSPKMTKYMELLREDVMKNGRDQANEGNDTYTLVTNHQISDYRKTRDVLFEASCIVLFPAAGNHGQISRTLKTYVGLDPTNIKAVLTSPSRWVAVYKRCPMYVVHERGIYLC